MGQKLREEIGKQPADVKKEIAELFNTTAKLMQEGRLKEAQKYLMHNKKRYESLNSRR